MITATMTSKGQVTIPKAVRDELRLATGQGLAFTMTGKRAVLMVPVNNDVRRLAGILHRPGRKPVSQQDIDRAVRRHVGRQQ